MRTSVNTFLCAVSLALLTIYWPKLRGLVGVTSETKHSALDPNQPGWVLSVELTFKDIPTRDQAIALINEHAKFVKENEPRCLIYELLIKDGDELTILMLEKYTDRERAYLQEHKGSAVFQAYRKKLSALEPVVSGAGYTSWK